MGQEYTSMEEIYKFEIILLKLTGNQPFEYNKKLAHVYMLLVIIATKALIFMSAQERVKTVESFPRASKINIELYLKLCYYLWATSQVAVLCTTFRYADVILILLRKRLNRRYLATGEAASSIRRARYLVVFIVVFSTISVLMLQAETGNIWLGFSKSNYDRFYNQKPAAVSANSSQPSSNQMKHQVAKLKWLLFAGHQLTLNLSFLSWNFVRSGIVILQGYGHQVAGILILGALDDMIRSSCEHDNLLLPAAGNNRTQRTADGRRPLGTTMLLMQVRQALVLLRHILRLEFLCAYLYAFSRLAYCLAMIHFQLKRRPLDFRPAAYVLEYWRLLLTVSALNLSYFWLHKSLERLRRLLEQRRMLESQARGQQQLYRCTIIRLCEEIANLSPTDWFRVNLRTIVTHQIYLLTVVMTLDQLVEASLRGGDA